MPGKFISFNSGKEYHVKELPEHRQIQAGDIQQCCRMLPNTGSAGVSDSGH